jgi:REP element-mobilizing transposase RayT
MRLPTYDYSRAGAYFVTVVVTNRQPLFGLVGQPNDAGNAIGRSWCDLARRFPTILLDEYVIMPDHFHGILFLRDGSPKLGRIIGAFKSITTVEYARQVHERGWQSFAGRLWQRDYFERVIRNERELLHTRAYIRNNVL